MKEILKKLNACNKAIEWAGDRTIEQAVAECHRGDWLLWLASKLEINHRNLTLAMGMCANTVRHLMQDERSLAAVDAAIAYGNGDIGEEELANAANAAAYAAYAAYDAYAAKKQNQKQTADICRDIIGTDIIIKFNELL